MNKKITISLSVLLFSTNLFAAGVNLGRIVDVKGAGFLSAEGKTVEVSKGAAINGNTEITVEHNGQISFVDNADHRFYLSNQASVAMTERGLVLRSGNAWVQSTNKNDKFKIVTANATVEMDGGEGIVTYDSNSGKTQLMVINGLMKISNLRTKDLNVTVSEGNFSYVDNAYDEGAPRDPTPVGKKTYEALIGEFKGVAPMDKNSAKLFKDGEEKVATGSHVPEQYKVTESKHEAKREIASEHEEKTAVHGEVKHDVADKNNAHKEKSNSKKSDDDLLSEYKNSMLEKKSKVSLKKASKAEYAKTSKKAAVKNDSEARPLVVQIYGQKTAAPEKSEMRTVKSQPVDMSSASKRMPASVETPAETHSNEKVEIKPKEDKNTIYRQKETDKLIEVIKNL